MTAPTQATEAILTHAKRELISRWVWRAAVLAYVLFTILRSSRLSGILPNLIWQGLQFGTIAASLALLLFLHVRPSTKGRPQNLYLGGIVGFLVAAIASTAFSVDMSNTLAQWGISVLMFAFLLWNAASRWRRDSAEAMADVVWLVQLFVAVSIAGIVLWLLAPSLALGYLDRFVGVFNNANYAGMIAALTATLALVLLLESQSKRARWTWAAAALPLVVVLIWSESRTSWVALVVGAAVAVSFHWRTSASRILTIVVATVLSLSIVLLPVSAIRTEGLPMSPSTASSEPSPPPPSPDVSPAESNAAPSAHPPAPLQPGGTASPTPPVPTEAPTHGAEADDEFDAINRQTSGRLQLYVDSFKAWTKSPIFGHGYRNSPAVVGGLETHNLPLQVLVETGALGFLALLAVLCALWTRFRSMTSNKALVGPVLVVLVLEMTSSSLLGWGGPTALYFWSILTAFIFIDSDNLAHGLRRTPVSGHDARERQDGY